MKLAFTVLLFLLSLPSLVAAQIVLPPATSPVSKIPIAVSVLKTNTAPLAYGKDFISTVEKDLRAAALFDVRSVSILFSSTAENIDFAYLNAQKIRYLVNGSLRVSEKGILYDLRVYDVSEARVRMSKKYVVPPVAIRSAAHEFAGKIMKEITGLEGFFDSSIVFVKGSNYRKDLFIMDYDGENLRKVTKHSALIVSPDCSADGKSVIFSSNRTWDHDLYRLDFEDMRIFPANGREITRSVNLDTAPRWSPDGSEVAFSRDGDIYIASPSGEILRRLTVSKDIDTSPAWSPDGRELVFVSDAGGMPNLYVMSSDGKNRRKITYGGYNTDPSWSRNSYVNRIAFVSTQGSESDIYTISPDGTGKMRLTSSGNNEHPSWSPNGYYITFSSGKKNKRRIYMMYLNGENKTMLSRQSDSSFSTWCAR